MNTEIHTGHRKNCDLCPQCCRSSNQEEVVKHERCNASHKYLHHDELTEIRKALISWTSQASGPHPDRHQARAWEDVFQRLACMAWVQELLEEVPEGPRSATRWQGSTNSITWHLEWHRVKDAGRGQNKGLRVLSGNEATDCYVHSKGFSLQMNFRFWPYQSHSFLSRFLCNLSC